MKNRDFSPHRRAVLASLGSVALLAGRGRPAFGQSSPALSLVALPAATRLGAGAGDSAIWSLAADPPSPVLRFRKGGDLQVRVSNKLPIPVALNWLGIDGVQAAEFLTAQTPIPAAASASFTLPLRYAGTFAVNARLLGDTAERPSSTQAFVVEDGEVATDRDDVVLIEDWRVKPNLDAIAPGIAADGTTVAYSINGLPSLDLKLKPGERLRLRVINGCQRTAIGLRFADHDVRIMAIDSQPAEPFIARDGQLVLAPGSRVDALIDATQPPGSSSAIVLYDGTTPRPIGQLRTTTEPPLRAAPLPPAAALNSSHLPAQLDLQNAARVDLALDAKPPWIAPTDFKTSAPPAFQAKRGRVVVVAVANSTAAPLAFRLHGQHFRLLDRLDDGWKPFWLDTLMLNAGQTQRIAFLAEYPGNWLIEATGIDWASRKLVRFYAVA